MTTLHGGNPPDALWIMSEKNEHAAGNPPEKSGGMTSAISDFCIRPDTSIRDAIVHIDRSARISIALLLDEEGRFLNTITDGDIRRAILAGIPLESPVRELLPIKARLPHPDALTAPEGTPETELLGLMKERGVRQIPLLDPERRVVDVVILKDLLPQVQSLMQAVIMAGGQGVRLRPLTEHCPKPMLPVAGRPLMELTLEKLQQAGIRNVKISTNYLSDQIMRHFGDGSDFGLELTYLNENLPLGTAGALNLMKPPEETVLVMNGDVLTEVDFQSLLEYHQEHGADMTVGVRQYAFQVPYGVVDCEGAAVRGLREKPEISFFVNAGIYLIEPGVYEYIPAGRKFDMPDLIERLIAGGGTVVSFPIMEYWLDVGQHADYERAQSDASTGKYTHHQREADGNTPPSL